MPQPSTVNYLFAKANSAVTLFNFFRFLPAAVIPDVNIKILIFMITEIQNHISAFHTVKLSVAHILQ